MIEILNQEFKSMAEIAFEALFEEELIFIRRSYSSWVDDKIRPLSGIKFIDGSYLGQNVSSIGYETGWYWHWS